MESHPERMGQRIVGVTAQQRGGDALAVYLEPGSKHGLHRFAAVQVPLLTPSWYPVLRVLDGPS